jgi:Domain of unknown function (DUF4232)
MDELDLLTELRAEVPLAATPRAEQLFRTGLAEIQSSGRTRLSHRAARRFPGLRGRRGLRVPRVAVAVGLAAAVTAGILIAVLPSGQRPAAVPPAQAAGKPMNVQLLADLVAKAAQSGPSVPPGQWVYRKVMFYSAANNPPRLTEDTWNTADGTRDYQAGEAGEATTDTSVKYSQLGSLPKDPVALDAYLAHLSYPNPDATQANKDVADFSTIEEMLETYVLPPALTAELYHALADIPTVTARADVTDVVGRRGMAFVLPATPQSVNLEIIVSSTDYRILADAAWSNGGPTTPQVVNGAVVGEAGPVLFNEFAILSQAFVSGPGVLPTGTHAASPPAAATTPECAASGLFIRVDTVGQIYAGGVSYTLKFTNLSGHACTLYGYPGVWAVTVSGRPMGSPATGGTINPATVTLANGATATATLQITDPASFGTACFLPGSAPAPGRPGTLPTAAGLHVIPPNPRSFSYKVIPFPFKACYKSGPVYLRVTPVHD